MAKEPGFPQHYKAVTGGYVTIHTKAQLQQVEIALKSGQLQAIAAMPPEILAAQAASAAEPDPVPTPAAQPEPESETKATKKGDKG